MGLLLVLLPIFVIHIKGCSVTIGWCKYENCLITVLSTLQDFTKRNVKPVIEHLHFNKHFLTYKILPIKYASMLKRWSGICKPKSGGRLG